MHYDLIIVGAGNAGLGLASRLAGFKILVIDLKSQLGKPSCTGLVTQNLLKLVPEAAQAVINRVDRCLLSYPGGKLELHSPQELLVLDRIQFDQLLGQHASQNASIQLRTQLLDLGWNTQGFLVKTNRGIFRSQLVVGADGARSKLAGIAGLSSGKFKLLRALQARVSSRYDPDRVEIYLDPRVSRDFFGWVVPEDSKLARIGMADSAMVGPRWRYFLRHKLGNPRVISIAGGALKLGLLRKACLPGLVLVGDAASQSKPLTGGGIVYAQLCAQLAAGAILPALEQSDPRLVLQYELAWRALLEHRIKLWELISKLRRIPGLQFSIPLLKLMQLPGLNLIQWLGSKLDLDLILKARS